MCSSDLAAIDAPADAAIDAMQPDAQTEVRVAIDSVPSGANIVRAKRVIATTPATLALPIGGDVVLVLQQRGYADRRIVIAADRASEHHITLTRLERPPAAVPGRDDSVNPFAKKGR